MFAVGHYYTGSLFVKNILRNWKAVDKPIFECSYHVSIQVENYPRSATFFLDESIKLTDV